MRRNEEHPLLAFTDKVLQWQLTRGRAAVLENPAQSLAWDQPPLQSTQMHPCAHHVVTDMCCYGLGRPDESRCLEQVTHIVGKAEICQKLNRRCKEDHEHGIIEGNLKVDGKNMKVSVCAQGYTSDVAEDILQRGGRILEQEGAHELPHERSTGTSRNAEVVRTRGLRA